MRPSTHAHTQHRPRCRRTDGPLTARALGFVGHVRYDWGVAERALTRLESTRGVDVQRPPLAYSDEAARAGAEACGRAWYFSVGDFERALLHGTLELRSVDREPDQRRMSISLSEGVEAAGDQA